MNAEQIAELGDHCIRVMDPWGALYGVNLRKYEPTAKLLADCEAHAKLRERLGELVRKYSGQCSRELAALLAE